MTMLGLQESDPDTMTVMISARAKWWVEPMIWSACRLAPVVPSRYYSAMLRGIAYIVRDYGLVIIAADGHRVR